MPEELALESPLSYPADTYGTVPAASTEPLHPTDTSEASEPAGTADVAKDQAASVGQSAADAGGHVAAVAKDQAQNVVAEAGGQARDLLDQTRTELSDQARVQQQRLAGALRALGDELHSMTQHSEQAGVATDVARQASNRSHDLASWLDGREPGHVLDEVKSFAQRRPGAFLAFAAGAGLLAGRLTRGVKDASDDDSASAQQGGAGPSTSSPSAEPGPAQFEAGAWASSQDGPSGYPSSGTGL